MERKRVAILQSNYIPWKGYFDLINSVDEFIIYDEVQYTKNDWRNRNKIKTAQGVQWLTIPVRQVTLDQKISNTKVAGSTWSNKHLKSFFSNYRRAKFFEEVYAFFEPVYKQAGGKEFLSDINLSFIHAVCRFLEINTRITSSSEYTLSGSKNERLVSLVKQAKGNVYLSGPSAKSYLEEELFAQSGISVKWMDYSGYPEYSQVFPSFEHGVTILDLLFNCGKEAPQYMKSFKEHV